MGYTMELWAVPVHALVDELTTPSLGPEAAAADDSFPVDVAQRWSELAAAVAGVIRAGGGEVGGLHAVYVHAVIRTLATHYGSLDHTSLGGDEFRRRFLPGPVADRVGRDFVAALVNRALAGLTWADYPLIGWLSVEELRAAAAQSEAADDTPIAPEDEEPLWVLVRAVRHAAHVGIDLISVYG